ncbi:adhesion G-protein coupled receptor G2-like [Colossoma macropomum]|uniref:adhesion G-protein coupled receptor G2-like n=1 Tax=Colossoma macropomum TaxID=42526 RepID=UPI00186533BA|nr:adhesion G-protein coupled receptor G2-like [Colossoma macropomum]
MKWTAGVKFGPSRSVVVLAVILGLPTLSLCKSCELSKTCTSIVVIDGDYTGPMEMPNSTCPNNSGSSFSDTVCFFSFNTLGDLRQELAEALKNSSTSYTTPTLTVSTAKTTTKNGNQGKGGNWWSQIWSWLWRSGSQNNSPQTLVLDGSNTTDEYSARIIKILEEINSADKVNNCTYEDIGMWLLKINSTYHLRITRDEEIRPKAQICFVKGKCNNTWQQRIGKKFIQCVGPNKTCQTGGCNVTCLDPTTFCNNAEYTTNCESCTANDDIIDFKDTAPVCSKIGTPVRQPDLQLEMNSTAIPTGTASEAIKSITSGVLKMMGDKTTASVTVGDAQGVFVKPKDRTKLEAVSFIYSEETNLSIIEDTSQTEKYPTVISIPKEAFEKAANIDNITLFTSVFRFPNFTKDVKNSTVLNNEVYSIDMGTEIVNLINTINLIFRSVKKQKDVTPHCHSWDGNGSLPNWITDGCSTTETGDTVTCECVHLTFFAVLMAPDPTETISSTDLSNLTYITSIGCGLSIFFLGVALFMHFLLRRSRQSDSVHILINLFVALVLLNLTFLTNEYVANTGNLIGCKLMAGFMHYCLLTSFTWFGLEALHLCLQLGRNSTPIKHYLTKICIAGWAPPAVVVTVVFCLQKYNQLVIHADDGKDVKMCWITDSAVHYVVNIGYYSIIFTFTFTTFVVMLRWIFLLKGATSNRHERLAGSGKHKGTGTSDALTVMGLCCTLGLTWGFAFFAYGALRLPSYYIFTILNSFQGFFLFIYYYKTSKFVGDQMTSEKTSTATEATSVENPYERPKPL